MSEPTEPEAMSEAVEAPPEPEPRLDLPALERQLAPLRRLLRYATGVSPKRLVQVRFVEVNGLRAMAGALSTRGLPSSVMAHLSSIGELLDGVDALAPAVRVERVRAMHALVARIDALLGLPMRLRAPNRRRPRSVPSVAQQNVDEAVETAPGGGSKRSRSGGRRGDKRRDDVARPSAVQPKGGAEAARVRIDSMQPELVDLGLSDAALGSLLDAGVHNTADLLYLRPTGEELVQPVYGAGRVAEAGRVAVGGRVRRRRTLLRADGTRCGQAVIQGAGQLEAQWEGGFTQAVLDALPPEGRVVLVGHIADVDSPVLTDPEITQDDGKHAVRLATYGIDGLNDRVLRGAIGQVLTGVQGLLDPIPATMRTRNKLPALSQALIDVHSKGKRAVAGVRRMAFDEGLLVQLGLLWPRYARNRERGVAHSLRHSKLALLKRLRDIQTTDEQQFALDAIKRDLRAPSPMRRVLTGEVGTGKGLVAVLAAVLVAESKSQVMLLAPDRATIEQRFVFAAQTLKELGFVARLVDDEPTRSQRDAIRRGEVHVVFGTSELLEAGLEFRRLGLVLSGERDVYGGTRAKVDALRTPRPDLLVITATPVPEQVLMTAFGEFDVTIMRREQQANVPCRVLRSEQRQEGYDRAREVVDAGRQVTVVFPMSRGADVLDAREATRVVSMLEAQVFEGKRVGLFHGGMSRDERYSVYEDFRHRRIDVLVATTHFEAGPPVPGASLVVIEQADRMSPTRLHRVRGHIASHADAECLLITGEQPDAEGVARVEALAESTDGFVIGERELQDRGLESLLAEQAQAPEFHWLDVNEQAEVLDLARGAARELLDDDAGLRRGNNVEVARYLKQRWSSLLPEPCPVKVGPHQSGRRRRRRRKR